MRMLRLSPFLRACFQPKDQTGGSFLDALGWLMQAS
jgi:hypothetical protein